MSAADQVVVVVVMPLNQWVALVDSVAQLCAACHEPNLDDAAEKSGVALNRLNSATESLALRLTPID